MVRFPTGGVERKGRVEGGERDVVISFATLSQLKVRPDPSTNEVEELYGRIDPVLEGVRGPLVRKSKPDIRMDICGLR